MEIAAGVRDGTDGFRGEDDAVGVVPGGKALDPSGQSRGHDRPGELIVGQARVAHVGAQEDLIGGLAGNDQLAVGERAFDVLGVDDGAVGPGLELLPLLVGEAEAPVGVVVTRDERDCVRLLGDGVKVGLEFLEGQFRVDANRVAHHVEVGVLEVNDGVTIRSDESGFPDHPLLGDRPVEDLRARRDLVDDEARKLLLKEGEGLSDACSGDTAVDRPQASCQVVHVLAFCGPVLVVHACGCGFAGPLGLSWVSALKSQCTTTRWTFSRTCMSGESTRSSMSACSLSRPPLRPTMTATG